MPQRHTARIKVRSRSRSEGAILPLLTCNNETIQKTANKEGQASPTTKAREEEEDKGLDTQLKVVDVPFSIAASEPQSSPTPFHETLQLLPYLRVMSAELKQALATLSSIPQPPPDYPLSRQLELPPMQYGHKKTLFLDLDDTLFMPLWNSEAGSPYHKSKRCRHLEVVDNGSLVAVDILLRPYLEAFFMLLAPLYEIAVKFQNDEVDFFCRPNGVCEDGGGRPKRADERGKNGSLPRPLYTSWPILGKRPAYIQKPQAGGHRPAR